MDLSGYACAKAFIQIKKLRKSTINFFMIEIGEGEDEKVKMKTLLLTSNML
jgi:hypothetical protein